MKQYIGEILTITKVFHNRYHVKEVIDWSFTDEMLETVKKNEEITEQIIITCEGKTLFGEYYKNGKCVKANTWVSEDGCNLESRESSLIDKLTDLYSQNNNYSLVKCIGYTQCICFNFTVGKIYKVYNNGKITSDNGYTYDNQTDKESILRHLSQWYLFEEIEK